MCQNTKGLYESLTEGGHRPPSPSPDDLTVKELCPTDFIIEENKFDSAGVYENADKPNEMECEAHNDTIYDIEINEDIVNEAEVTFVNEVVTVADVFNDEVHIEQENKKEIKRPKIKTNAGRSKPQKTESSHKGIITSRNIVLKKRMTECLEEEHELKMKIHRQELCHQQLRHKLEIDILLLEKEKKELEIKVIKKSLE